MGIKRKLTTSGSGNPSDFCTDGRMSVVGKQQSLLFSSCLTAGSAGYRMLGKTGLRSGAEQGFVPAHGFQLVSISKARTENSSDELLH